MQCPICNVLVVTVELDRNRHLDSNYRDSLGRVFSDSSSLAAASSSSKNTSSSKKNWRYWRQLCQHSVMLRNGLLFKYHLLKVLILVMMMILRHQRNFFSMNVLSNDKKINIVDTSVTTPLAERLRLKKFSEFIRQDHLIGPDSLLLHLLPGKNRSAGSMIFWGLSGCGRWP